MPFGILEAAAGGRDPFPLCVCLAAGLVRGLLLADWKCLPNCENTTLVMLFLLSMMLLIDGKLTRP